MWRCGSISFVWLPFIIRAAPNFISDPDPLVLKAYTPAYVQSQKRQKKFTEILVLEKPKLPPKKTGEDPSKGVSAQDLLKGQADPVPQEDPAPTPSADPTPFTSHGTRSKDPKSIKIRKSGASAQAIIPPEYIQREGIQR